MLLARAESSCRVECFLRLSQTEWAKIIVRVIASNSNDEASVSRHSRMAGWHPTSQYRFNAERAIAAVIGGIRSGPQIGCALGRAVRSFPE
jgi:hypothetical protein